MAADPRRRVRGVERGLGKTRSRDLVKPRSSFHLKDEVEARKPLVARIGATTEESPARGRSESPGFLSAVRLSELELAARVDLVAIQKVRAAS